MIRFASVPLVRVRRALVAALVATLGATLVAAMGTTLAVAAPAPLGIRPVEDWRPPANLMAPSGPHAERVADLGWILLWIALAVFLIVGGLLVAAALRRGRAVGDADAAGSTAADGDRSHARDRDRDAHRSDEADLERRAAPWLIGGSVATALVLVVVAVLTFTTMAALAAPDAEPAAEFEVVGKQWWWEIRVDGEVVGANEIHIPVGRPVLVKLRSDNVIHSFWVPDLAGKRDLVPGHPNELWLQADEAGVYRGICAEFCGRQHAKMGFTVVAEPQPAFDAWLRRVRAPAAEPRGDSARRGRALFTTEGCAGCHAVRGTGANGALGPDLTHLASRRALAAATIPNTRGHLAGWIVDPWSIKPGALMPPQDLSGAELQALLDYLADLE